MSLKFKIPLLFFLVPITSMLQLDLLSFVFVFAFWFTIAREIFKNDEQNSFNHNEENYSSDSFHNTAFSQSEMYDNFDPRFDFLPSNIHHQNFLNNHNPVNFNGTSNFDNDLNNSL